MTVLHIQFNPGTQHGALLRSPLRKMEESLAEFQEIKGTMALMIDGDGSSPDHFAYIQEHFGFLNNDVAKAAWDELNSLLFKLTTNASVDNVNAAMLQVFNKFR